MQRLYAHAAVYDELVSRLSERISVVKAGDPTLPDTQVGPLVDTAAAERVEAMVRTAVEEGASLVCGGDRDGDLVRPALLTDAEPGMEILQREVFGPVLAVVRVDDLDEAIAEANNTTGALQVGVFTRDIDRALAAADELDAGSVIINGSNTFRIDSMPYGGTGTSGFGREGVRAMVEEITQPKVVVVRRGSR